MEKSNGSNKKPLINWLSDFYGWKKPSDLLDSEDFVKINRSILLVKFNPKTARDSLWVAANFSMFCHVENEGFLLYQCDSPSPIRKNIPLRFFYNKKYGKAFILDGQNKPIYEMFKFMLNNEEVRNSTIGNMESFIKNRSCFLQYCRHFFDNVAGLHGRFEIIEPFQVADGSHASSYDLLKNRIETNSRLLKNRNPEGHILNSNTELNIEFHKNLKTHLHQRDQHIISNGHAVEDNKWLGCYMIFKATLFKADISVDDKGSVLLSNESDLSHYDILNEEAKKSINDQHLVDDLQEQYEIYPI